MAPFPETYQYNRQGKACQAQVFRANNSKRWIVILHGHGGSENQIFQRPDHAIFPSLTRDAGYNLISPDLGGNSWLDKRAERRLVSLVTLLGQDAETIILWGGSMGGTGALIFSILHPQLIDGTVALCPASDLGAYLNWLQGKQEPILQEIRQTIIHRHGTDPGSFAKISFLENTHKYTKPLFISHAADDPIIPIVFTDRAASRLANRENFSYVRQENGGHDGPLVFYRNTLALTFIENQLARRN